MPPVLRGAVVTTAVTCPRQHTGVCLSGGSVLDADVARMQYVSQHGGLYLDTDARCILPPRSWPQAYPNLDWDNASLLIGIEFPCPICAPPARGPDGSCLQFTNWAFAATAGNRILSEVAHEGRLAIARRAHVLDAVHATGPGLLTRVVLRHIGHVFNLANVENDGATYVSKRTGERVLVLPYRAFGIHMAHRGSHIKRHPTHQQLVRHQFKGSWRHA